MNRISQIIKNHIFAIILALLFGVFSALPTIIVLNKIGITNFKGVYPVFLDDTEHYLSQIKDIQEGHGLGNVYLKEHKNEPYVLAPLGVYFYAKIANWTGVSAPTLAFLSEFILVPLNFLLVYILFFSSTGSKKLSLLGALFLHVVFLREFARIIIPQVSYPLMVLGLLALWQYFQQRKIKYILLLDIIIGLLVYIQPFYWSTLVVIFGLLWVVNMMSDYNKKYFLDIAYFALPILIFSFPYLQNLKKLFSSPYYNETLERIGKLETHFPGAFVSMAMIIFSMLALFYLFVQKNKQNGAGYLELLKIDFQGKKKYIFAGILFTAGAGLNWQNVITGVYLQLGTHYIMITVLLVIWGMILFGSDLLIMAKSRVGKFVACVLFLLPFAVIANNQKTDIPENIKMYHYGQERINELASNAEIFDWLNKNTPPESVIKVYSTSSLESLITVYTNNNVDTTGYAGHYLLSDDELENRWIKSVIYEKSIDEDYVINQQLAIWFAEFSHKYAKEVIERKIISLLTGKKYISPQKVPDQYIKRVLDKFKTAKSKPLELVFKVYPDDYIIIDISNDKFKEFDKILSSQNFLRVIKQINQYKIYKSYF